MSLWGNKDQSNSAPKSIGRLVGKRNTATNNAKLYGNTTGKGVFGVDVNEAKANDGVTHPGWVLRTVGTGGRAGRVFNETIVAMGSMQTDSGGDDGAFKNVAIKVTVQPSNVSTTSGNSASFAVSAIATPNTPLSYLWSANTGSGFTPLTNTAPYSNTATATLYIANTAGLNGAQFRVSVSATSANTKTSKAATLSVH